MHYMVEGLSTNVFLPSETIIEEGDVEAEYKDGKFMSPSSRRL